MANNKPAIVVYIDEQAGIEKSLRKFKRMCESYGVVKEYKKRQDYKKPSVRLKEKTESAVKRRLKSGVKTVRRKPAAPAPTM